MLLRAGAGSLHRSWVDADTSRNWDLYLAPYQPIVPQSHRDCVVGEVIPGPKWSGLREVLGGWQGWQDYERIWLPDDDIAASSDAISHMFDVAEAIGLDLFAPALDEASHYAHFTMMQNRSFFGRWTGFVEIMVPGFSRFALERLLHTFELTETGWGLGLDSVWPRLLDYRNIGVLDGITVTHTRPIGERRDDDLARSMLEESAALLARYDCRQVHTTFGAFGPDLEPLHLTPERLLVELVEGWRYLFQQNPQALAWIVDFQRQRFPWPDYPVEGTPGGTAFGVAPDAGGSETMRHPRPASSSSRPVSSEARRDLSTPASSTTDATAALGPSGVMSIESGVERNDAAQQCSSEQRARPGAWYFS